MKPQNLRVLFGKGRQNNEILYFCVNAVQAGYIDGSGFLLNRCKGRGGNTLAVGDIRAKARASFTCRTISRCNFDGNLVRLRGSNFPLGPIKLFNSTGFLKSAAAATSLLETFPRFTIRSDIISTGLALYGSRSSGT